MVKKQVVLRLCPNCGEFIKRSHSESWPTYNKKTACSVKCGATLRESKVRNKIDAMMALAGAISKWSVTV